MKKILFLGFFLAQCYAYAQTEEDDGILDSVLDELFQTDSFLTNITKSQYLYTNF